MLGKQVSLNKFYCFVFHYHKSCIALQTKIIVERIAINKFIMRNFFMKKQQTVIYCKVKCTFSKMKPV